MRFAIVVPVVYGLLGVRETLLLAKSLSEEDGINVDIYIHTLKEEVYDELRSKAGKARIHCLNRKNDLKGSNFRHIYHQLTRKLDKELSRFIESQHELNKYEAIVVCGNEGHWIPEYVRKWKSGEHPIVGVYVQEIIDHIFLLKRERDYTIMRTVLFPLLPLLHFIEDKRLSQFDVVVAVSDWTSQILQYLYGHHPDMILSIIDVKLFAKPKGSIRKNYIALPTASLDKEGIDTAIGLFNEGINLISYGSREIKPIPHMGFLDDTAMIRFLAEAKATLFLFDYEGLGLIPLESLSVGTPVITYDKQGPFATLIHAPEECVSFGHTYESLKTHCVLALSREITHFQTCVDFMTKFSPEGQVKQLIGIFKSRRQK